MSLEDQKAMTLTNSLVGIAVPERGARRLVVRVRVRVGAVVLCKVVSVITAVSRSGQSGLLKYE